MEASERPNSPKPSPNTKRQAALRKLQKLNKDQLSAAIKKKKECNAKAQKVVEKLIDPFEGEKEFIETLKDINQSHYQDIVEERAIMKLCGYPLCCELLVIVPKQQFHISTNSKKVYDLSERKNYCSGICLRKSSYVKAQLLTSPLWMRDQESIPEFKLLSLE